MLGYSISELVDHLISVEIPQVLDYFDILLRVLPDNVDLF